MKLAGTVLLLVGLPSLVLGGVSAVPEIDAGSGAAALIVLSGALLVIRGRRRR